MKLIKSLFIAFAILLLTGCAKEYDDTALQERVDALEEQAQENANAIKKLLNKLEEAAEKGVTVSVTQTDEGSTLTFSDGTVLTVKNGVKGEQGPQGQPGDDGADAVVTIEESADGLSYVITVDGNEYIVKKTLTFSLKLAATEISLAPGESEEIAYTLVNADEATTVFISACSGYSAVVDMNGSKVTVTAPAELPENGFVIVTALKNSTGEESSQYIGFIKGNLTVTADAETVGAAGGVVTLTVNADCDYNVIIPEDCTWIKRVESKAMVTSYVYLDVAANTSQTPRSATVVLSSSAGVKTVVIAQAGIEAAGVMEAANCFIISEAGVYKFRTVKGNSDESVGNVAGIDVLWETFGTAEYPNKGDLIKSVSYADGVVTFETVTPFVEGNAGIVVKSATGKILWSWHIWLTDKPEEQVYYNNAGTFLDRNLGATSAVPGEVGALGLLYQWGRKDPFLGSASISEVEQVGSTLKVEHDNSQYSDWPTVSSDAECGTIEWAIANPTTFIGYSQQAYGENTWDWIYSEDMTVDNTSTRWSSDTKTIYDPCPAGWRIPGIDVYQTMSGTTDWYYGSAYADEEHHGCNWGCKFGDDETIWYPLSGDRGQDIGNLSQVAVEGHVWTSTLSDEATAKAYILYNDIYGAAYSHMSTKKDRSKGYAVRCVKIQ